MYDVIIIGAGASGLMAAAAAASKGARVALLEHKDDIGKKILATGNGRCNFTNTDMSVNKFHGSKALIKNGLSQFNYADTIRFFKELGIPAYDNAGYIYPNSRYLYQKGGGGIAPPPPFGFLCCFDAECYRWTQASGLI